MSDKSNSTDTPRSVLIAALDWMRQNCNYPCDQDDAECECQKLEERAKNVAG